MLKLALARLLQGGVTLFLASVIIFIATSVLPGDAAEARLRQNRTPEALALLRHELALDRSLAVRYGEWIGNLATGNLGVSFATGRPVSDMLSSRLSNTLRVAALAALIALPIAVGFGFLSALWRGGFLDRSVTHEALRPTGHASK